MMRLGRGIVYVMVVDVVPNRAPFVHDIPAFFEE